MSRNTNWVFFFLTKMINYQTTTDYWVYAHITPDGLFYIGTSQQQPCDRWRQSAYKETALYEYIQKYGWENIKHFIFKDGLTREQAMQLEDLLIQEATEKGYCINKQRSGLIEVSDRNAYNRQLYAENEQFRERRKVYKKAYMKQRNSTPEGKIYYRVASYNKYHPDLKVETPLEAKKKYLENGYLPDYIKNDDLN